MTDEHPGTRPAVLAGGLAVLVLGVLPIGALVRERWGPLLRLDNRVESSVHRDAVTHGVLRVAARAVTQLGAPLVLDALTVAVVGVLLWRRRQRLAGYLAACMAGAYALSSGGKLFVARARPVLAHPFAHASGTSFPSGHATGSAAFYLAVAVVLLSVLPGRRRLLFLAAVAVPLVVAASRVVLGVHYVSDVVAGLLLGWGWTAACTAAFTAWRAEEECRPVQPLHEGVAP